MYMYDYLLFIYNLRHNISPKCHHKNTQLKVMTYNIFKDNKNQSQIDTLIHNNDPDIIWVQELKAGFYRKAYQRIRHIYPYAYPKPKNAKLQSDILLSKYPYRHVTLNLRSLLDTCHLCRFSPYSPIYSKLRYH